MQTVKPTKQGQTEFQALIENPKIGEAWIQWLSHLKNERHELSPREEKLLESLQTWQSLRQPQKQERIPKYSKEQRLPKDLALASKRRHYRKLEKIKNKGKRPRLSRRPTF